MKEKNLKLEDIFSSKDDLENLCRVIRSYVEQDKWEECDRLIPKYMELYPHSAVPHNLMGIVLEKRGRHADAMRHFRAAASLDASYRPVTHNMDLYASMDMARGEQAAFDETDLQKQIKPRQV